MRIRVPPLHSDGRAGAPAGETSGVMETMSEATAAELAERVTRGREQILAEIRKVIVGQDECLDQVLIALFTGAG